ncbi:MAG: SAM-dependent chlorinase/fluorinase [Methylacidiphilales bacterium]|nr:SAM-dependent chlorinase/fluorinase [Candidatus Methylacidiphilales bacterium]
MSGKHPLIGLMTDYGTRDAYVAQMKGMIYSIYPQARIEDLNHEISVFNLPEASYLVDQTARYFAPGSIFVVVVDPGVGTEQKAIILKTTEGRIFIGPDNGIFTSVMEREGIESVYELTKPEYFRPGMVSETFHGRDIYGPVAAHVAAGETLSNFGPPLKTVTRLKLDSATRLGTKITAHVVHIDHYGNVITNVPRKLFEQDPTGKLVKVSMDGKVSSLPVVKTYANGPEDRLFAIFNSEDNFELSFREKPAAEILKVRAGAPVSIVY